MAHSRSPDRSRSRNRQPRAKHHSHSPNRPAPVSRRSRSRSRSPLRRSARSPKDPSSKSPPPSSSRQPHTSLRRGPRSPRRGRSSSRSSGSRSSSRTPRRKQRSRSPAPQRGGGPPGRRHSLSPGQRKYSSRSPQRRDSRRHIRSRSRDRGDRDGSRDRRDGERSRRGSSRDRGYNRDREWQRDHGRDSHDRGRWQQQQQRYGGVPQLHTTSRWDRPRDAIAGSAGGVGRDDGSRRQMAVVGLSDDPPAVGSIHTGVVHSVKPFGVFVAIESHRKHVLVHQTQVSEQVVLTRADEDDMKVKALEFAAPPGQRVWVKILEVSPEQHGPGFRVHGSMRVVDQDTGQDMDPTGQLAAARGPGGRERLSDDPPEVGTCHRGEVKRIEAYGVFVALQGYRRYGLVHASQVANYLEFSSDDTEADRKKALSEVVDVGQDVWVKVVEVTDLENPRGPKIGCSMKLVDQSDGTDLDPQNLRYRPRGDAGHGGASKAPIGAAAGEVKGGTVDWGYLATRPDAFGSAGYNLLGDEPEGRSAGPSGPGRPQQQQQQLPPVGRGRGAVLPAWMTGEPAAPGSKPHRDDEAAAAAAPNLTLEEALRIVQAAAGKKRHKDKHKKHKKHKKSSKSHKKGHKHSKDKRRHSSSSSGSGSSNRSR